VDEVLQKSDRVAKLETELAGLRALVVALLADNSTTDERFAALVRVNDSEHAAPVKFEAHRLLQLVQATDAQTAPAAPVADVK
jgi:hypothetical protein